MRNAGKFEGSAPLPDWPMLLTSDLAAAILSVDEARLLDGVRVGALPGLGLVCGLERWSRRDLERRFDSETGPAPADDDPLMARLLKMGRRS